jgi:hypothetical protein
MLFLHPCYPLEPHRLRLGPTPRMKRRLIELVAAETEPLDPVVVAAAALLP